ncbi:DUF3047 domain-containing protein [Acetobacter persici]|uniref:DUF3047 domain-containing protein n=1 Tax=Acetobacter persici TaxID=1076596 RepID=UPI0036DE3804
MTNIQRPEHWAFMGSFGEVTIFSRSGTDITMDTHDGDCCILETPVDILPNEKTRQSSSWLVDKLPSELPEDLILTHDYVSVAIRFDNRRDLTYLWRTDLPTNYHFARPLPRWCDRETHRIVESGTEKLGQWEDAVRPAASDYRKAIGGPLR